MRSIKTTDSIARSIWLSLSILILGYLVSMGSGFILGKKTEAMLLQVSEERFPIAQMSEAVLVTFREQIRIYSDAVLIGDTDLLKAAGEKASEIKDLLAQIASITVRDDEMRRSLSETIRELERFTVDAKRLYSLMILDYASVSGSPRMSQEVRGLAARTKSLQERLGAYSVRFSEDLRNDLARVGRTSRQQRYLETIVLSLCAVIGGCWVGLVAVRRILRPVQALAQVARRIQAGELHQKAAVASRDEIGDLAAAFNSMTEQLTQSMQHLQREIEERNLAMRALAESESRQRSILSTAMDGYCLIDRDGRLRDANETYCRMVGYDKSEILSKHVWDLEAAEDADAVAARMEKLTAMHEDRFQSLHRRKDESLFNVEVSIQYRKSDGGQFVCFIRDITERLKLERQLLQAQKMESIGNLAGGIAHDFNNLLFPMVGMSELLLRDLPPRSPEFHKAEVILKAARRGSELVRQILAFSRQSEKEKSPVLLEHVVQEVMLLGRSTIPANIELTHTIAFTGGRVLADATQLHQLIMNLLTNAYHAVEPTSGQIHLGLQEVDLVGEDVARGPLKTGRHALITIADTGCGIAPAVITRIFDPYFTTKEKGKGTGLGLAVVYGIVREHGGDIKVYSELGKGTTFQVYLPLLEGETVPAAVEPSQAYETGSERILLVDDDEAIVELEKLMLEQLGYQVLEHHSSLRALDAFKAAPKEFDLVMTDMTMPEMTGDELAKALISTRPGISIIICTGFSERLNPGVAERMGVKAVLMKPVTMKDMARTVRHVLDKAASVN